MRLSPGRPPVPPGCPRPAGTHARRQCSLLRAARKTSAVLSRLAGRAVERNVVEPALALTGDLPGDDA